MERRLKVGSLVASERIFVRWLSLFILILLSFGLSIRQANAHIIDHIEINQVGEEAEIHIVFDVKIQYLREASLNNGEIHLFFNILEDDPDKDRLVPEGMNPPPSELTKHFSVVYPGLDSSLTLKFDEAVIYRITTGQDGRSISVFTPVIVPSGEAATLPPAPVQLTQEDIEVQAKNFIDSARYAIQHDQLETAIETLNRLLLLPPNKQAQDAQELIGQAREMNGEIEKARAEYEIYLKLYPDAANVNQVKDRLAHLPAESPKKAQVPRVYVQKFVEEKMTVYGGLSQYYYKGVSHTDAFSIQSDFTTFTSSSTGVDQSQLLSNFDITGQKRTEKTETRMVLREYYNANYLPNQKNDNRLNNAYIEQSARDRSYLYRLGRQSGLGGGVLGSFDGLFAGYSLNPTWRINGVYGTPVQYVYGGGTPPPRKNFVGTSIDLTRLPDQWSGSGYFVQQHVEGFVDRQAVGLEAHYFELKQNYMGMFEYDTLFKKVNMGMLQRNWTTESNTNFNMLIDHRRSPPLQMTNALVGRPSQSIADALQSGAMMSSLRADAIALNQISNMFSIGMSHPYSPRLRLGGDFRITNTGGTGATNMQPASQGSGNSYTYSFNALGNNILFENDLGVVNASYTSAQNYKGHSLAFTQVETIRKNWRVDMLLQLYRLNSITGVQSTQVRPSMKLNYRANNSFTLEGEGGLELYHTSSATQNDKTTRKYFYIGYRWDFH